MEKTAAKKQEKQTVRYLTQAHAPPSESSARQCHPPVAACTIREPSRAEILRGFLSAEDDDDDEGAATEVEEEAAEAFEGPCPSVPLAFQPQASTRPSASSARVHLEPATSGQRLKARPRRRVPRSASTTFGERTSAAPSSPSWPSSLTPDRRCVIFPRGFACEGDIGEKGGAEGARRRRRGRGRRKKNAGLISSPNSVLSFSLSQFPHPKQTPPPRSAARKRMAGGPS